MDETTRQMLIKMSRSTEIIQSKLDKLLSDGSKKTTREIKQEFGEFCSLQWTWRELTRWKKNGTLKSEKTVNGEHLWFK